MKILALEPYYGGSHRQFLDGWSSRSRHEWTILGLPAYKWKWRMRHAAVTFAAETRMRQERGAAWDMLFCSDMLNLAEFLGLLGSLQGLPSVVYFHENQLSYPVRYERERDYHFAATNMTTALAADEAWFNSAYHMESFFRDLGNFLKKMPDYNHPESVELIRRKSLVFPQGIDEFPARHCNAGGPARILWNARWEYDKDPESFFKALRILKEDGCEFRLNVVGERFKAAPSVFEHAREEFDEHIDRWGYQEKREEYVNALCESDIVVSTAKHEFFGVGVVEAVAAGALPILPRRLAYPEIIIPAGDIFPGGIFYEGGARRLARKLRIAVNMLSELRSRRFIISKMAEKYAWRNLTPVLDDAIERAAC